MTTRTYDYILTIDNDPSLLDIGSGRGEWMQKCNAKGFRSIGIELDYRYIEINEKKIHKKKFSPVEIEIIKQLNIPNLSQKMACYKLKTDNNIQISVSTLGKIWRGEY